MRITVEIGRGRKNEAPCAVKIYFDEEGFDFLLERLSLIRNQKTDHVHFFTPSWGSEELSEEKIFRYSNYIAHHLKLTMVQTPVPSLRIAVEIEKESKSKVPCAVEIYFDEEGLDSLLEELSFIRNKETDHVHFFTPSCGEGELSEGKLFCYSNDRVHHLRMAMLYHPPASA